jgi:hypothetical protein
MARVSVDSLSPTPRFDISVPTQVPLFLSHLEEHGYAVVASVVPTSDEVTSLKSSMWDFLESFSPKSDNLSALRRDDPSTWDSPEWFPNPSNGIVGYAGQSEFMWRLRLLPRVRQAFEAIWGTPRLLTSFDVCNAFRPYTERAEWLTDGGWWHLDQNANMGREKTGKVCIQGLVALTPCTPSTGGLCVIPGSHKHHTQICSDCKLGKALGDFIPVEEGHEILRNGGKLVTCEAGDLCVWDSRTVHCNTPADLDLVAEALKKKQEATASVTEEAVELKKPVELLRMVGYVCMTPRRWASKETLEMRTQAFKRGMSTSHWPHCNLRIPRIDDDPDGKRKGEGGGDAGGLLTIEDSAVSPEMRELIGYPDGNNLNGCNIS